MKENESASVSTSAATSASGPDKAKNEPGKTDRAKAEQQHKDEVVRKPDDKLSEADFLLKQTEDAKAAIGVTVNELAAKLKEVGDLRLWTKQYPWIATALAAGAGFATALAVVPKDKADAKRKWDKVKHAVTGHAGKLYDAQGNEYIEARPAPSVELRNDPPPPPKPGWLATLVTEGIKTIRPALVSFITAGVTAKATEEGGHNGDGPELQEGVPVDGRQA